MILNLDLFHIINYVFIFNLIVNYVIYIVIYYYL